MSPRARRHVSAVLTTWALSVVLLIGPASAQAVQPGTIPPGTWLSVIVPVVLAMIVQTALGFRFIGKQEGAQTALTARVDKIETDRAADTKALRDDIHALTKKLEEALAVTRETGEDGRLMDYRMKQLERNTEAMMALRDSVTHMSATMAEQHRQTTETVAGLDRRVTNVQAQLRHVASGGANVVQAFPAE